MTWQHWLKGLAGAAISGASTAVTMAMVDPAKFNVHDGLSSLGKLALVSGVVGAAAYLKQSPVPAVGKDSLIPK